MSPSEEERYISSVQRSKDEHAYRVSQRVAVVEIAIQLNLLLQALFLRPAVHEPEFYAPPTRVSIFGEGCEILE